MVLLGVEGVGSSLAASAVGVLLLFDGCCACGGEVCKFNPSGGDTGSLVGDCGGGVCAGTGDCAG